VLFRGAEVSRGGCFLHRGVGWVWPDLGSERPGTGAIKCWLEFCWKPSRRECLRWLVGRRDSTTDLDYVNCAGGLTASSEVRRCRLGARWGAVAIGLFAVGGQRLLRFGGGAWADGG